MQELLTIITGDWIENLKRLPGQSVHCCVTSPPYWGLRDYGVPGQLGLEKTAAEYVAKIVEGFREVWRVLRSDGTLWLNLGDSYASFRDGKATPDTARGDDLGTAVPKGYAKNRMASAFDGTNIKHKDLVGIPWRVAFALQGDGWYLRSDIIWSKPNPMPESVKDRPTKAHEYIFLMAKSERYYFDAEAIKEPLAVEPHTPGNKMHPDKISGPNDRNGHSQWETSMDKVWGASGTRNKRTVWTVPSQPYPESHFATFPEDLIKPCILAGCPVGGIVLDPFAGSGTTGQVALELGRKAILIELNPEYIKLAGFRTDVTPGLALA